MTSHGKNQEIPNLTFYPLTDKQWGDIERLFGERGACGGCWCMWWKLSRSEFMKNRGEANKKALRNLARSGKIPGIIACTDSEPVGWCAVAPRTEYPALERSRVLRRIDDEPVWSIVCFFVARKWRNKGLTIKLLNAAVDYVKKKGGRFVEGYPVDARNRRTPDPFVFTGLMSAFEKAGFREVARHSQSRPIMRRSTGTKGKEGSL